MPFDQKPRAAETEQGRDTPAGLLTYLLVAIVIAIAAGIAVASMSYHSPR